MAHRNEVTRQTTSFPRKMLMRGKIILLLVLTLQAHILVGKAHAATLFVSKQGDNTTGQSWSAAFTRISSALSASISEDQIWIASGTYTESITLRPSASLYGGFRGFETELNQRNFKVNSTTIDGSTASSSVILGATGAILDGLRIVRGNAVDAGGGLHCENARLVLRNCRIEDNLATSSSLTAYGGGILSISSDLVMTDCIVARNEVRLLYEGPQVPNVSALGGGICVLMSSISMERCTFIDNIARCDSEVAQTILASGAGLYAEGSVLCDACEFWGNRALAYFSGASFARGGGIASNGFLLLDHCTIGDNLAQVELNLAATYVEGGGVFTTGQSSFSNSRFFRNRLFGYSLSHQEHGGGVSLWCEGDGNLENCTVLTDWPESPGEIGPAEIRGISGIVSIRNSITGSLTRGSQIEFPNVMYSDILEGFPGEGNINLDPQFVDPANGDFRLLASSPCIDAGTTTGPSTDILGKTRPVDVPGVGRDGAGAFDMGAYEFQLSDLPTPTPTPTITETPTITPTSIMTETPTATPTRDPNASWVREWDVYR